MEEINVIWLAEFKKAIITKLDEIIKNLEKVVAATKTKTGADVINSMPLSAILPTLPMPELEPAPEPEPEPELTGAQKIAAEIAANGYAVINDNVIECPGIPPVSAGDGYAWTPIHTVHKDGRLLWERVSISQG